MTSPLMSDAVPLGRGPYSVGSTNMELASAFADIGDDEMHELLLGRADGTDQSRFVSDILKCPKSSWVTSVPVPDEPELYGSASGLTLPVASYLVFPTKLKQKQTQAPFVFPYHDGVYGSFENMLRVGEAPDFADSEKRYPLILIAHGLSAHGVYDVQHAHDLASHGYIVAVLNYGDNRTVVNDTTWHHAAFLRPLLTKAVLDSILESETFGPRIDTENIGITGHSFGGFTALALAGGHLLGNPATVNDKRIKASVIAAPWVGRAYDGIDVFAFGHNNSGLRNVTTPTICLFGTQDTDTPASFILPAMKQLAGPTYVVELVDQLHVFEPASWQDRNGWELLFFSAYLKGDSESLALLKTARSMTGGNENVQLFDYQK